MLEEEIFLVSQPARCEVQADWDRITAFVIFYGSYIPEESIAGRSEYCTNIS